MQKQKKQFAVICVLLVLCIAGFLLLRNHNKKQEEQEETEETFAVTELNVEDITSFSYYYHGEKLTFTKSGEDWLYEGDHSVDIDEDLITSMLSAAAGVTASDEVTEYEDLSEYGLEEPSNTIVLTTGEGDTTLYFGSENEILSKTYIKTDASDTVYLTGSSLAGLFEKSIEDLTVAEEETAVEGTEE